MTGESATLREMGHAAKSHATYEDVLAAPPHVVAELIGGELHTQPRPAIRHAHATSVLSEELGPPFRRGRGGPGGWLILFEPEVHLGSNVLVPDLAGWRRETLPELPDAAYIDVRPDWVAEVLSPGTRMHDRVRKMPLYQAAGTSHVWLLDPEAETLEVFGLDGASYRLLGTYAGTAMVYAAPFDAFELSLGLLWER